jgi:putative membrane protein
LNRLDDALSSNKPDEDPRVRLAAERTLLAWIRTGLALMGFGFVVARFGLFLRELAALHDNVPNHHSTGASLWIGIVLVTLGVGVLLVSAYEHHSALRRLERGEPLRPPAWSLGVLLATVLAVVGAAMVAYLALLGH